MQKIKIFFAAAAGLIALFSFGFFLKRPAKANDELVVGMMSGWAPFMVLNPDGQSVGFDVDVANLLAKRLNKKLVIKDLGSLASCFVALEQNKIDLLMSGLDITQDRLKKLAMIPYTGEEIKTFSLLFWKNIPTGISSLEDLKNIQNATVCAEPGSAQDKFLNQYAFITKKPIATTTEMLLELRYSKSLAVILEPQVANRLKKQEPSLVALDIPLPDAFKVYGMGIALKKSNQQLVQKIEQLITALKKNGELSRLETTWGLKG